MRGEQIAAQRASWRAALHLSKADLRDVDAVVVVKRTSAEAQSIIRSHGVPMIYDPLDFWRQPKRWFKPRSRAQKLTSADGARDLFRPHFATYDPDLVLCVTRQMADDLAPLGYRTEVLYHHADPRLPDAADYRATRQTQTDTKTLLYFGNGAFLRDWARHVHAVAQSLGVNFITLDSAGGGFRDPPVADAMIAVRGGRDGCWISRSWKSNVKAATAAQLGLPLVAWPEAAYRETAPDAYWFEDQTTLRDAIQAATQSDARGVSRRFTIEDAATRYEQVISDLLNTSDLNERRARRAAIVRE